MGYSKLISSKQVIGELFADYNIEGTNWLGSINRYIARAIELMRMDGSFVRQFVVKELNNYRTALPCDNKYIIGVVTAEGNRLCRLPISNSFYLGQVISKLNYHPIAEARIDFNYLITTLETGKVGFLYYSLPVDKEGDVWVPDNPFVLEALPYFVIMKLALSGYKHPVISREEAEAKWTIKSIQARNDVNFPTIEEMEKFTMNNTNPYYEYIAGMELEGYVDGNTQEEIYLRQLHKED